MADRILNIGFIGNGKGTNRYHAPFSLALPDKFRIKTIQARHLGGPWPEIPGVEYTTDMAAMLADPAIEAVEISTPHSTPYALTKQALEALHGCRILGIEANHDREMLATGPYPYFLQKRVGGNHGHLSNAQAAEALPQLLTSETQTVVAMHISQKNNLPELAHDALCEAVGTQAEVLVASQTEPLTIW
jgi:hypothetical protein